jgi:hypothetical protein
MWQAKNIFWLIPHHSTLSLARLHTNCIICKKGMLKTGLACVGTPGCSSISCSDGIKVGKYLSPSATRRLFQYVFHGCGQVEHRPTLFLIWMSKTLFTYISPYGIHALSNLGHPDFLLQIQPWLQLQTVIQQTPPHFKSYFTCVTCCI